MNIVDLLEAKNATANLRYYGKDDFASGFQIKTLVDCKDDIIQYYDKKKYEIKSIDDYIDYLFIEAHVALEEVIPIVRDDIKEDVKDIIEHLKKIQGYYRASCVNKYIKKDYQNILSRESHKELKLRFYEMVEYTINYIKGNYQIFKDEFQLYEFLVKEYAYRVFESFEEYKNIFDKYPQLLDILFSEDILKNQMSTKLEEMKDALKYTKKNNKKLYDKSIEHIVNMVKKRSFNTSYENVMYTYSDIKEARKLMDEIADNYYREFDNELQRQGEILNAYLHQEGHKVPYEVNIQDFVKMYENVNEKWEVKSLMLTHGKVKNEFKSRITSAVENKDRRSIMDTIVTLNDTGTNSYFPYSTQVKLMLTVMYGELMIKYMISDEERYQELINYMFAGVGNYVEKNSIDIPDIEDDFNMISYALKVCTNENYPADRDELVCRLNNYNVIHLMIGVLEKILREIFYKYIGVNKYIPKNALTLDNILKTEEMEKFIGRANARTIRFFLTSFNNTGKGLRNDIAHYKNIKEICTFENVLMVLYLCITITNELLLKVIK